MNQTDVYQLLKQFDLLPQTEYALDRNSWKTLFNMTRSPVISDKLLYERSDVVHQGFLGERCFWRMSESYAKHTRRKRHRRGVQGRFVFLSTLDMDDPELFGFMIETIVDLSKPTIPAWVVGSVDQLDRAILEFHLLQPPDE